MAMGRYGTKSTLRALLLSTALGLLWGESSPAAAQRIHEVRSGHTLARIARNYRVAVWDLALANELRPDSTLRPGQVLSVPPRGVTYVRPGQTLSHVAKRHDCSVQQLMRLNGLGHPGQVRAGQRLKLPGYLSASARKRDWGEPDVPGQVRLSNGEEQVEVQLVDAEGRVVTPGLEALSRLMGQDGGDGPSETAHPRLAVLVARISDHFGGRPIHIVSGFREAVGYTRETSRHLVGRAADIQVRGVPRRVVWEFCRSLAHTGCGYYPRSVFVHVDARPRHAQWVDWSRPGKRPRYGTLRRPYRRRERRNPKRPRVTRRITRPDAVPLHVTLVDERGRVVGEVRPREEEEREVEEEATPTAASRNTHERLPSAAAQLRAL